MKISHCSLLAALAGRESPRAGNAQPRFHGQNRIKHTRCPLAWQSPPGPLGNAEKDIPTLTPFFPDTKQATGAAMVICPGGAYAKLAPHEGQDYARWPASRGVTCFVLKYRLGTDGYRHPIELMDGSRAIRLVRDAPLNGKLIRIASASLGLPPAGTRLPWS